MKVKEIALAVVAAALLAFVSGCAVSADYPSYAGYDAYYYYPDYEVYYYPRVHQFWWRDGDDWRHGDRAPDRFDLHDRDRVRIDMDHPPHTDHGRVREMFPSHHASNQATGRGDAVGQRGDSGGQHGDAGAARGGSSEGRGGDAGGGRR
jgi:uncharacterized membrane protein YgcG